MAMPTRESSGLVCKVDAKGRMSLHMDGKRIQGVVNLQADTSGMSRGTMTITVLTQFVTFDQVAGDDAVNAETIDTFTHLGHQWTIVLIKGSFYARDDHDVDTGPYGTAGEAREWVEAIVPA